MDLGMMMRNKTLKDNMVWIYLTGKLKGKSTVYIHKLRSVAITGSGVDVETWRDRLLKIQKLAGRVDGPAITNN